MERKNRLLKVCYVPATSATLSFFLAVAINSTNEANKKCVRAVKPSMLLRCLWYGLVL